MANKKHVIRAKRSLPRTSRWIARECRPAGKMFRHTFRRNTRMFLTTVEPGKAQPAEIDDLPPHVRNLSKWFRSGEWCVSNKHRATRGRCHAHDAGCVPVSVRGQLMKKFIEVDDIAGLPAVTPAVREDDHDQVLMFLSQGDHLLVGMFVEGNPGNRHVRRTLQTNRSMAALSPARLDFYHFWKL